MNEQIKQIVKTLKANAQYYAEVQPILREFVTDKTYPLEERAQVWVSHCTKENREWMIYAGEFGPIGDFVEDHPDIFDRGVSYDWEYFLNIREYDPDFNMSREDCLEMLIATNFGSFRYDW